MLVFDLNAIGNNLYQLRKKKGLTQAEVAERAELSDRTYADIERGNVTMRVDSLLKICSALHISPNDILTADNDAKITEQFFTDAIKNCTSNEKKTALNILNAYISSLNQ